MMLSAMRKGDKTLRVPGPGERIPTGASGETPDVWVGIPIHWDRER